MKKIIVIVFLTGVVTITKAGVFDPAGSIRYSSIGIEHQEAKLNSILLHARMDGIVTFREQKRIQKARKILEKRLYIHKHGHIAYRR